MPSQKVLYIEFLTTELFFNLLNSLPRKSVCFYFDSRPSVAFLIALFARVKGIQFERLDFEIVDALDEQGLSIFWRILYQDITEIQQIIATSPQFLAFADEVKTGDWEKLYLAKTMVSLYDIVGYEKYRQIWHALILIQISKWHSKNNENEVNLFIFERTWFAYLRSYADKQGISLSIIKPLPNSYFFIKTFKQKLVKLTFSRLLKLIGYLANSVRIKFCVKNKSPQSKKECLWTEYWGQLNLDKPYQHSDLFFIQKDGVTSEDVLLSFNMSLDPLDEKKFQQLREYGVRVVALSPYSSCVPENKVSVFRFKSHVPSDNSIKIDTVEKELMVNIWRNFVNQKEYWRSFIKAYDIKTYVSWYKYEANHIPITSALREEGGISAIYQKAYEPNPSSQLSIAVDIVFGLSLGGGLKEKEQFSVFHYYVCTGYVGDYRFGAVKDMAKEIRQRILSKGARKIISYFDENTLDDGRWFPGHHGTAQENYRFWLEKLLNDPELGIIFKPKKPSNLKQRLGPVADLLTQAEQTGRCMVLRGGLIQGGYPPVMAAVASDIAIHECLNAGTAGLEAALAGVPTLLVDLEGWKPSPLYQLGPGVVFTDWPSAWGACQAFLKDPKGNKHLGDWSSLIPELDPFHDGKAALRMSQYLKWLLEGLRSGENRENVMAMAAERYAKQWGKDKIQYGYRQ